MGENQAVDLPVKYMKETGRENFEEFCLDATRAIFAHVYYTWKTLKAAMDPIEALDLYWKVWEGLAVVSFESAKQALGIKEVNDIPTLGRIFQYSFLAYPCLYNLEENTEDSHVGIIDFCPNPMYGPKDNHMDRLDYYRQEAELSRRYIWKLVELAGMKDKVEADQDLFMCRDGSTDHCRIFIKKK
ncbi:MAG: hypothetical protein D6734_10660 [Candidatus Schekmanbacteria bacterium]|nr:MAG: hypothetical protein D6734_10660 [Candidatus Schekmanbacteria bacterium]